LALKCAVKGAGLQRVQLLPGNWFAPPGRSNRDGGVSPFSVYRFYFSGAVGVCNDDTRAGGRGGAEVGPTVLRFARSSPWRFPHQAKEDGSGLKCVTAS
jgi:hypothetical protein